MSVVIAIDGPAAAGKGTLSKRLAEHFGFDHLDTGLLYRAVGAIARETGGDPATVAANLRPEDLRREDLRTGDAGEAASVVAVIPEVRANLLAFQRRLAASPPGGRGIVIDGRDIGTVICPDAAVKLFVTASAEERARRRHLELMARGEEASLEDILHDVRERDRRDTERATSPLKAADDAVLLDTTDLDAEAAFATALAICGAVPGGKT